MHSLRSRVKRTIFTWAPLLIVAGLVTLSAMAQVAERSGKEPFGIVIHGGAGSPDKEMTKEKEAEYHAKLNEALDAGHAILERGGSSLDAVTAAIVVLEDSPLFNAGKGAVLNYDGKVELDASIMDGHTAAAGAVTGVKETKNPILLARTVMEKTPHVMLAGDATDLLARAHNLAQVPNHYFETEHRRESWKRAKEKEKTTIPEKNSSDRSGASSISDPDAGFGTVGAVALDRHGNLAAGTSTGGRLNKMAGRVGDSPIIGAGTYANNQTCAVSGTGAGEYYIRAVAAHSVSVLMEHKQHDVMTATQTVLDNIKDLGGSGGLIAIDKNGQVALPFNTPGMYRGYKLNNAPATVEIWPASKTESNLPVRITTNVSFLGSSRAEKLDLYAPATPVAGKKMPGFVWIHGGGLMGGTKNEARAKEICTTMAGAGYVAVSIDYKLGHGAWPQNLLDCKNAVRFLRARADEYGIDTNRIAVAGGSAGGYLALMVGFTTGKENLEPEDLYPGISSAVNCVIDMYGPVNYLTRVKTGRDGQPTGERIGLDQPLRIFGATSENDEVMRIASPLTHITKDSPPVLILHGRADTTVDYLQSEELALGLKRRGVEHELILLDRVGHTFSFQIWNKKPLPRDLRPVVFDFLTKHMKDPRQ